MSHFKDYIQSLSRHVLHFIRATQTIACCFSLPLLVDDVPASAGTLSSLDLIKRVSFEAVSRGWRDQVTDPTLWRHLHIPSRVLSNLMRCL